MKEVKNRTDLIKFEVEKFPKNPLFSENLEAH